MTGLYRTIVADPPWRYGNQSGAIAVGHARRHYSTMALSEIKSMDVASLATPDAHLWVWAVNQLLDRGFEVCRAWGFEPLTVLTWCKPGLGVGYYLRNSTEHCVFATRGKPMVPEIRTVRSWQEWRRTSTHSSKPDAFYDLVEEVSPSPYAELFSRRARFGWDYPIGDQALGGIAA